MVVADAFRGLVLPVIRQRGQYEADDWRPAGRDASGALEDSHNIRYTHMVSAYSVNAVNECMH